MVLVVSRNRSAIGGGMWCLPSVFTKMCRDHAAGRDLMVVGSRGSGKSTIVSEFGRRCGYDIEAIAVHRDTAVRDLLQRRATDPDTGDTVCPTHTPPPPSPPLTLLFLLATSTHDPHSHLLPYFY